MPVLPKERICIAFVGRVGNLLSMFRKGMKLKKYAVSEN